MQTNISGTIKEIFQKSGVTLPADQIERFIKFYKLLDSYNSSHDLTRIFGLEERIIKHFVDSIFVEKNVKLPDSIVDIGTGAGFPGIPLKIIRPDVKIILAEPKHKRVEFMKIVIDELGLENVEVYPHMVTEKSFFNVNGVITRALETVDETLSRVSHFLPKDGIVIFMKGPESDGEMSILSDSNVKSYRLDSDKKFTLPGTSYNRRIVSYRKTVESFKKTYRIFINSNETIGSPITSAENKKFKELKSFTTPEGIKKSGSVIVSGKKIIGELYKNSSIRKESLIIFDEYEERDEKMYSIINDFASKNSLYIFKKSLYNEIDIFKTGSPLLSVSINEIEQWDGSIENGCTMMVPFQDPENVGAVIRSGIGFGVKNFIILRECANPYHPKSIRSSSGAVFLAGLKRGPSLYDIDPEKYPVISLDKKGASLGEFIFPEKFILLPGIEGQGVPEDLKNRSVSIPLQEIESLNASAAVSVALYQWMVKRV